MKVIYLDMDGTIADLYGHNNWLEKIRAEEPIFEELKPMPQWDKAKTLIRYLKKIYGYKVGVITWTPMNASAEYEAVARVEKNRWLSHHAPEIFDFVTFQRYGTPKELAIKSEHLQGLHVLIDDNEEVRKEWVETLQPAYDAKDMIVVLRQLIQMERMSRE